MEFKLSQILESTILLEGRKEDAIKKYGEEHSELVNMLSDVDPSGNNKYLDWMVKTSLGQNQDEQIPSTDIIIRTVNDFHKQLTRIKNKDINSYKKIVDLKAVVDEAKKAEEEKNIAKQAKKVYEDDTAVIYAPFTVQASCKYGAGSKWCIAGKSNDEGLNNYFDDYSKHSNFYFLINKKMNVNSNPRDYKYALQWRFDGSGDREWTWWDAQDNSHNNPPSWVTDSMMEVIKAFDPKHKKIKLGAQAKAFLDNPNIKDYKKFQDIITPEQKTMVINKIIETGDLNSNTFATLAKDLTDEQKMNFITNYVKDQVNVSDYKNMKEHLNIEQKMTLVKYNPTILNNYDVMNDLNSEFTDDQKYSLSKVIDSKQINNTDSKVLYRKWSMSPEQRAKHGQTSYYVFLSSPESFVDRLVKVDPLDPESYRTINMMKLRKQVQSDINMYGIKTQAGLLDEYVGSNSSSIPEDIIELMQEKSTKV
jgi:hypothetical protein